MRAVRTARSHWEHPGPDPAVLAGNVVAGACWLAVLVVLDARPLALIGALYVAAASAYLSVARRSRLVPWLGAAALWAWLLASVDYEATATHVVISLVAGTAVGSLCFAAWQASAAAVTLGTRPLLTRRA
jgi:hypothetical protein